MRDESIGCRAYVNFHVSPAMSWRRAAFDRSDNYHITEMTPLVEEIAVYIDAVRLA